MSGSYSQSYYHLRETIIDNAGGDDFRGLYLPRYLPRYPPPITRRNRLPSHKPAAQISRLETYAGRAAHIYYIVITLQVD